MKIPVVYSEDFYTDYDTVDCESPDRISSIYFKIVDIAEIIEPDLCTIEDLKLCHSDELIDSVKKKDELYYVAKKSAGGAIKAAQIALERPSFALIRPPGHHAGYNFNGGFCFFNNMAIAIKKLLKEGKINSALIVDIDLHYGNGTYDIVKNDERIRFKNIDAYPRGNFMRDLRDALEEAADFDIVGCSAGFDTYIKDWGALLTTEDFKTIGYLFASSNPNLFSILEGGYYIPDLGLNVRAFLEGIMEACS
ncbi:MAG TPA: hypothetical protein PLM71_11600 [Syntrophorhabdaceae bacterium]|nr:hypothetical protein [Syntrophorhabdaceae bacterium]HPU30938.1 hypothetical protein [Syntrophorhabdaceae bacterium]